MLVGVPKEIKDNEYRVGLVPSTVRELTTNRSPGCCRDWCRRGCRAGDADYQAAGAEIVASWRRDFQTRRTDREGEGTAGT